MPRTAVTAVVAPGSYNTTPTLATPTAIDIVNNNLVTASGKDLLIFENTSAGALTITVNSVNDAFNRTGDITAFSVGAGQYAIVGPLFKAGWVQADGNLYFTASAVTMKVTSIQLP